MLAEGVDGWSLRTRSVDGFKRAPVVVGVFATQRHGVFSHVAGSFQFALFQQHLGQVVPGVGALRMLARSRLVI